MGIKLVNVTKYGLDGVYIGNEGNDGWIYFNDDRFYRFNPDTGVLQHANLHLFWQTTNIVSSGVARNATSMFGTSSVIEKAIRWMYTRIGLTEKYYSQSTRNLGVYDANTYDCSSFVLTSLKYAGLNTGSASTTRNMKAQLTQHGFKWIEGSSFPADVLQVGDILLKEATHTQMYVGNNIDISWGGETSMCEIPHCAYLTGTGWDGILRYVGD